MHMMLGGMQEIHGCDTLNEKELKEMTCGSKQA